MGGLLLLKPKSFYHSRRRSMMVRCVCVYASPCYWFDQFTLLIWPKGQNRKHLTISRCWFDQKVKTESIWPVHVVDLTKRSKREGIRWPLWVGKLRRKCKAPPPKMGFGGLPKQPRLPPEILAFSSVFQVCFKCVNFFNLTYILILLIIFTFFLLTSHTHISFIDFQ